MNLGRMVRAIWRGVSLLGVIVAFGCSDLPELVADSCGNYVIEEGEDCDLHAEKPYVCAGPGEENACHYTCNAPGAGCPDGYGCGTDFVCRHASGTFSLEASAESYVWPTAMRAADFDADGNGDLLLLGALDSFGYRSARALFSQGFSLHQGLSVLPTELANPAVGSGAGTGALRDLAFADFEGVALLRGYNNETADFTVFPTIPLPGGAHARIVMTDMLPARPGDEFGALITMKEGTTDLVGIEYGKPITKLVSAFGGEGALVERRGFLTAHFDESMPCAQIIMAYRDTSSVQLFTPCKSANGGYGWNVGGPIVSVALQSGAKIDKGVIATDIDLDGHLDLVIGADDRTYVAFGLGDGSFTPQGGSGVLNEAAPYVLPLDAGGAQGFPLAIADLNSDGLPDFVIATGIVMSNNGGYEIAFRNQAGDWSEAVVANLNANAWPDVATIVDGALDVHFLNNAGNGIFGLATLPTEGVPSNLASGDFDGDLLDDLVFSEAIAEHGELSAHLSFSFGSPFGPPEIPVATGEVGELGQIVTGHIDGQSGTDPMAEIGVIVEGSGTAADSIALLPGRASRAIFSTLPLRTGPTLHVPISLAFGNFGDDTPDIVALATSTMNGQLSLFRVEAFDEEGLTVPNPSETLPANFIPSDVATAINLRYGATVLAVDLDNDGVDEAVTVGAYANRQQGAFAAAKYSSEESTFSIIDAQVFAAKITNDTVAFVDDIDGDGIRDIILTTGTFDSPSDLIVVWGDGSGKVPDLNQDLTRIQLESFGITAVASLRSPGKNGKMLLASTPQATYLIEFSDGRMWSDMKIPQIGPARAFLAIDFDHDGVEDVAALTEDGLELFRSVPK